MLQDNPFADLIPAQGAQPRMRQIVPQQTKIPDPIERGRYDLSVEEAGRSEQRFRIQQAREAARDDRTVKKDAIDADNTRFTQSSTLRGDYEALPSVKSYGQALPAYAAGLSSKEDSAGDLNLIYAYAKIMDPNSVVREGEQAAVAGGDTWVNAKTAELRKQLTGEGGTFQPEYRRRLREEMRNRMGQLNQAFIADRVRYKSIADRSGINPLDVVGEHPGARFQDVEERFLGRDVGELDYYGNPIPATQPRDPASPRPEGEVAFNDQMPQEVRAPEGFNATPDQEAALRLFYQTNKGFTPEQLNAFAASIGVPAATPEKAAEIADYYAKGGTGFGGIARDPKIDQQYREELRNENAAIDRARGGRSDITVLGQQGSLQGGSDEISGIGGAIGSLLVGKSPIEGYTRARDRERVAVSDARDSTGWLGTGVEIGSSLALPLGSLTGLKSATKLGAAGGALAGFGYGEGYQSVPNALTGAVVGGALGKTLEVGGRGVSALANTPARQAARADRAGELAQANSVHNAAQAEGVNMPRGLLDPRARNALTAVETTQGGGPIVQSGLAKTATEIEQGVKRLSAGTPRDAFTAGETIQKAGERAIKNTKAVTDRLYKRAETLAGNAQITPAKAVQNLDAQIAELSGAKNTNKELIGYLKELRDDLTQSGGLSIETLRGIRSGMRGQINTRNLSATDAERRVKLVLDDASADIADGLSGNPQALQAYKIADKRWGERQTYINDVLKRFMGPRDKPMSAEAALTRMQNFAKEGGDSRRLAEMMRSLSPDEAADISATFASDLGRDSSGNFSPALLATHAENLSDRAKLVIFGPAGKRSLDNLAAVANEFKKPKLNNSRSGVAFNYRGWLAKALGIVGSAAGAAGGYLSGGGGGAVVGAGLGAAVANKVGKGAQNAADASAARLLMDTDVSKWLRSAPRTTNPSEIDAHFKQLAGIAARNPSLAGGIEQLQQALWRAANDNASVVSRSAASGTDSDGNEGRAR